MTEPTVPLSPFRWKEDPRPSIFYLDSYFRSRQKAGLIDDTKGLGYKQFGTYSRATSPLPNKHVDRYDKIPTPRNT